MAASKLQWKIQNKHIREHGKIKLIQNSKHNSSQLTWRHLMWRHCVCLCAVHIDISRVFNSVLPQQCQPADSFTGAPTICALYTKWYESSLLAWSFSYVFTWRDDSGNVCLLVELVHVLVHAQVKLHFVWHFAQAHSSPSTNPACSSSGCLVPAFSHVSTVFMRTS